MFDWVAWRERRLKARIFRKYMERPSTAGRVEAVLALDASQFRGEAGASEERSLPSNPEFQRTGWWQHLLLRYFLAMEVAGGRRVLDACSGLGWGSFLVSDVAERVVGVDLDAAAVEFARSTWTPGNLEFVTGSVLELPFEDDTFDVVLCMESIEHFDLEDGRRYLKELARVCRPGGWLVGSSYFPRRRDRADHVCAKNPYHLYVYTRREMRRLLRETFGPVGRLTPHYFLAGPNRA